MEKRGCGAEAMDVLFINMPFAPLFRPSLVLSLLKARLTSMNVSSRVRYFTIPFAEQISTKLYATISNGIPRPTDLVGEFIFLEALYGASSKEYIDEILKNPPRFYGDEKPASEDFIGQILQVQGLADAFVNQCNDEVLGYHPKILVFSSVLQQNIASLALAKRIKACAPEIFIVFAGTNCHGMMGAELVRQFPFVDAVVSGECDIVFPEIVRNVFVQKSVSSLQGVYTPENVECLFQKNSSPNPEPVRNMDSLPFPDFDDFFNQHRESRIEKNAKKQLMFETSRGCWWGERSHCTFCGLNGESMFYRSKSPRRALEELVYLTKKYPDCLISAIDNILDMKYFKNFIPDLAAQELEVQLFYEVKANLKKEQIRLLSKAGISMIQPGVESFSTDVLALMGKGVNALQNIQLLKWCKENGIRPFWNILCGFPGEDPKDYFEMADLIPFITHLPAPQSLGQIRIERFSPNHKDPERHGFLNVKPYPAYFYLYPFVSEVVENLAYYFTYDYKASRNVTEYTRPLRDQFVNWRKTHEESDLFSVDKGDHLLIWDLRPVAAKTLTILKGLQRIIYLACDSICTLEDLKKLVAPHSAEPVSNQDVAELVEPMLKQGLMVTENHTYLSLAIPLGVYSPAGTVLKKFIAIAKQMQSEQPSL